MPRSNNPHKNARRKRQSDVQIRHALDLEQYLPYRFFGLTRNLAFQGKWFAHGVGISIRDWRILAFLAARGPKTNSEIAYDMGVDAATISRAIRYLRDHGLVAVKRSRRDRRTQLVALTQKGADVHDVLAPERKRFSMEVESCLTASERDALYAALDKIDAYFEARAYEEDGWD